MSLQPYFQDYAECYAFVKESELDKYLNLLSNALEPAWTTVPLTPYTKMNLPQIKIRYKNTIRSTAAFGYDIQLEYINGTLRISSIVPNDKSDILPPSHNEVAKIFAVSANMKGFVWTCNDGIIKLKDIMSDETIKKLELFEKANTNKSCNMTHLAAMRYLDFCESLYQNKEIDEVSEFWENILRDCCGFTAENAYDFAMTLSLRIK